MKLSHKITKLFRPEFYRRTRRRWQRRLHPIPLRPLLEALDWDRIRDIQARYASSPVQLRKYADVERWMKRNTERVQDLDLHRAAPQDILDLGCGGGFFLYVLRHLGHRTLGLDIDWYPLFGELIDLLGVERRIYQINAFEPLPDLGRKFDWITAFSTGFNRKGNKALWDPAEWEFFLNDLTRHLKPGGHVFIKLNPAQDGWFYTDELRDFFISRGAEVERERIYFPSLAVEGGAPATP